MKLTKANQSSFFNDHSPGDKFTYSKSLDFIAVAILADESGCSVDFIPGKREAIILREDKGLKKKLEKLVNYKPGRFKTSYLGESAQHFDFIWESLDDVFLQDPMTPESYCERKSLYENLPSRIKHGALKPIMQRGMKRKTEIINSLRKDYAYTVRQTKVMVEELKQFANQL